MRGLFTIYNQKLAGYLMINGFPLIKIVQDRRTGRDDYLFPDTELLRDFVDKWQVERLKKRD